MIIASFLRYTLYRLPKLHKNYDKSSFIAYFTSYTTTELSLFLTSCLSALETHDIKCCGTVYERNGKSLFLINK